MGIFPGDLIYSLLPDKELRLALQRILGFYPRNIELYKKALRHRSATDNKYDHNERLEFLGDAVFGAIVTDFLFTRFPFRDEGFLTQMKARLVSRAHLNKLARRLGIETLVNYQGSYRDRLGSLYGDAFEALIGAIFLDRGYPAARRFVCGRLFRYHIDLDEIENTDPDFKSRLINWSQRAKRTLKFSATESGSGRDKVFVVKALIDGAVSGTGTDVSKKKAEQLAAEETLRNLLTDENEAV